LGHSHVSVTTRVGDIRRRSGVWTRAMSSFLCPSLLPCRTSRDSCSQVMSSVMRNKYSASQSALRFCSSHVRARGLECAHVDERPPIRGRGVGFLVHPSSDSMGCLGRHATSGVCSVNLDFSFLGAHVASALSGSGRGPSLWDPSTVRRVPTLSTVLCAFLTLTCC
jgi:hypothetical protein